MSSPATRDHWPLHSLRTRQGLCWLASAPLTRAVLWMAAGFKGAAWITAQLKAWACPPWWCLLPPLFLPLTASIVSCASSCTATNETAAVAVPPSRQPDREHCHTHRARWIREPKHFRAAMFQRGIGLESILFALRFLS